jgi:hypothetical protein
MATYRYIVTVETDNADSRIDRQFLLEEIDSNLESVVLEYGLEHFTVEPVSPTFGQRLYPGQGFDSRYQS